MLDIAMQPVTHNSYSLPVSLAFLNSRALLFWEIMYYMAYNWQGPRPAFFTPYFEEPAAFFTITGPQFCRLLYGTSVSQSQYDTGRKMLGQLSRQAHQAHLLYRFEEADDPYLNTFGSQASQNFLLPLVLPTLAFTQLNRPAAFVENGWIRRIGNSYEYQLFNLLSLEPLLNPDQPDFTALAERLAFYYTLIPAGLQNITTNNKNDSPSSPITQLARQIKKAWGNLRETGLHNPTALNLAFYHSYKPLSTPTPTTNHVPPAPLERYYQKNPQRADLLARLLSTGLLAPTELKAAWTTLADFSTSQDFTHLLQSLRHRETLNTSQTLSWRQVEAMARLQRSKRGRSTVVSSLSKKPRVVFNRLNKVKFINTGYEGSQILSCPFRPAITDASQPLARVKLEVRVNVPNWRFYQQIVGAERLDPLTLQLRLSDSQHVLIFEDIPRQLDPKDPAQYWALSIEKFFQPLRNKPVDLFYFDLTAAADTSTNTTNTHNTLCRTDWFSLSIRLSFYPAR